MSKRVAGNKGKKARNLQYQKGWGSHETADVSPEIYISPAIEAFRRAPKRPK